MCEVKSGPRPSVLIKKPVFQPAKSSVNAHMIQSKKMAFAIVALATTMILLSPSAQAQCFGVNDRLVTERPLLNGFSQFTFRLYKSVCSMSLSPTDNVFFSPASIWSALLATYLGARNQTAVQLKSALGLNDMDAPSVAKMYRMLRLAYGLRSVNVDDKFTFRMANKLCFRLGEPVRQCIRDHFASELIQLDFAAHAENSRLFVNSWVEEQTCGKIRDLIPHGYVDSTTRMLLVNAAYFKGNWQNEFDEYLTEDSLFHAAAGHSVPVRMMNQQETYPYFRSVALQCTALEMSYSGGEMSMLLFVPDQGVPVEAVMNRLSSEVLLVVLSGMRPEVVSLSLPKFRVELAVDLEAVLRDLGIHDLLDSDQADLSGFTGRRDISVNAMRHKAFVEVNEQGTEAAAATALISFRKGSVPREFRVDRPFIFLIRDNVLDATLFMGLIRNPTA